MAFRSPTPDGLVTAPNAAGDPNNPAAVNQELQSHRYWGRYATETELPNNGANAATGQAYSKMRPGDVGYVQATGALYFLQDRGTPGGNDAVWVQLATGQGTVRDAHVFVIAQANELAALGSGAIPPNPTNNANLTAAGDVAGVTCDYLDPGDGTELEQALLAAAAYGEGVDIRLRPCSITLDPAALTALPLDIPDDCRLIGADRRMCTITGGDGTGATTQQIFGLLNGASIEELTITSPAPVAAPAAGSPAIISCGPQTRVRNCRVNLQAGGIDRTQTIGLLCDGGSPVLVEDCEFRGANGRTQTTPVEFVAIRFAPTFVPGVEGGGVYNCEFFTWNVGVEWVNAFSAVCDNCKFFDMPQAEGVLRYRTSDSVSRALPQWTNLRIEHNAESTPVQPVRRISLFLDCAHTNVTLQQLVIDNVRSVFAPQSAPDLQANVHCYVRTTAQAGNIQDGRISGIIGSDLNSVNTIGVHLEASAINGNNIEDIRCSDIAVRTPVTTNGVTGRGVFFEAANSGEVRRCSVVNSSLGNSDGFGVQVTAGCTDCHVLGNHLTPQGGGVALQDLGTGTEAAHNIV